MADLQHRTEDADHAPIPERTTPQGTLALTVDHGHEEVDVNFGPLVKWFVVLVVLIVFSHLVCFGFYRVLQDTGEYRGPELVFGQRSNPPEPRLLPNPADTVRIPDAPDTAIYKYETLQGPGAYGQAELERDTKKLADLGFVNPDTGLPAVPESAAQALGGAASSSARGDGLTEVMPSDPTGGRGTENRLR
jgi:hypothetical protein